MRPFSEMSAQARMVSEVEPRGRASEGYKNKEAKPSATAVAFISYSWSTGPECKGSLERDSCEERSDDTESNLKRLPPHSLA